MAFEVCQGICVPLDEEGASIDLGHTQVETTIKLISTQFTSTLPHDYLFCSRQSQTY